MSRFLFAASFMSLIFIGCTSHPKIDSFINREPSNVVPFVKAKFSITISDSAENDRLSAIGFFVPGERYRIEFYGPLGIHAASFLWYNSEWQMYIPDEGTLIKGQGSLISILGIKNINIHLLAGVFWNKLLPKDWESAEFTDSSTRRILNWSNNDAQYKATINLSNGEVEKVSLTEQSSTISIEYSDYQIIEPFTLPTTITHTFSGSKQLKIELHDVFYDQSEKEKYWKLKVPDAIETLYVQ